MSDKEVTAKKRGRPAMKKKAASVDERPLTEIVQSDRDIAPQVDEKPSKEDAVAVQGNKKKAASTDEKPSNGNKVAASVGQKVKKMAALFEEPSVKDVKKRAQREQLDREDNPESPPPQSVESTENVPVVYDAIPPSPQKKSEIKKAGSQTKAAGRRGAAPPKKVLDELPDLSDAITVESVLIPMSPQKKTVAGKKNGNKVAVSPGSREATPELDPLADYDKPDKKSGSETPPKKSVAGKKNGGKATTAAPESHPLAASDEPENSGGSTVPPKKTVGPKKASAKSGTSSAGRGKALDSGPLAATGEREPDSSSVSGAAPKIGIKRNGGKVAAAVVREKTPELESAKDAEPQNEIGSGIPEKRSRGRPKRNAEAVSAVPVEKPAPRAKPGGRGRKAAEAAIAAMTAADGELSD